MARPNNEEDVSTASPERATSKKRVRRVAQEKEASQVPSSPSYHDTFFAERLSDRPTARDYEEEARRHPTLLLRRTMRSGQRVRFHGHVVVLGDVNPGAEITAGGDIVVMGWLRGMAHAGAEGNERAIVTAFRLNPTQLRIAQFIARSPDNADEALPDVPELAEVRDGQLVIDRWQHSVLVSPGR